MDKFIKQSRQCIDKYLQKFGVILETCEKHDYSYNHKNIEGRMVLYINKEKLIGELEYDFNGNELFINTSKIFLLN